MSPDFRGEIRVGDAESEVNGVRMIETTGLGDTTQTLKAEFPPFIK